MAGKPSADDGGTAGVESEPLAPQGRTDAIPPPASTRLAAGLTAFVGGLITFMGAAHLYGVLVTASWRGYAYDFRFAGLLLIGSGLVFGSVLCLSAVLGLARGHRTAWWRAMCGTILLLLVLVLFSPLQPDMAPGLSVVAAGNLIALLAAWRRLAAA